MAETTELGSFLRAARERVSPADVGLPVNGRRRTPGLRREEVATLAGVSVDYLIRLEQGRDSNPSAPVIVALADALRMSDGERMHLTKLAAVGTNGALCPRGEISGAVHDTVRSLLDRFDATPAFVLNALGDILAWNAEWGAVMAATGLLDEHPPNLARYVFTHPDAPSVFADWSAMADEHASRLRFVSMVRQDDARLSELRSELDSLPEFSRRWRSYSVAETRRGEHRINHPVVGALTVNFEVLSVADFEQQLVVWLPADEATTAAFGRLIQSERPVGRARLRVVGD